MANLLERVKNTVLADINEVLDKKENKNPLSLLNHYLKECEKETEKVKMLVERQYKLKEEFMKELQQAQELEEKRKQQAEVAAKANEEELLSFATQEQKHYEERVVRLKESLRITEKQLHDLETKYMEMKHKVKDMSIRRMELMGKENITRAYYTIDKMLDEKGNNKISRFNEMEAYIEKLGQKINNTYYQHTIDEKIAAVEKEMNKKDDSLSS